MGRLLDERAALLTAAALRFRGRLDRINREIGANNLAEMAVHALRLIHDFRGMIPFHIERTGHPQHVTRTVFHAELTPLAAILDDYYLAPARLDCMQVKRSSPVFHALPRISLETARPAASSQDARVPRAVRTTKNRVIIPCGRFKCKCLATDGSHNRRIICGEVMNRARGYLFSQAHNGDDTANQRDCAQREPFRNRESE